MAAFTFFIFFILLGPFHFLLARFALFLFFALVSPRQPAEVSNLMILIKSDSHGSSAPNLHFHNQPSLNRGNGDKMLEERGSQTVFFSSFKDRVDCRKNEGRGFEVLG